MQKALAIGAILAMAATLCQCDRLEKLFKPKPAPKGPYAYTLRLEPTPAAAAEMKARNYHFNVNAFYYGRGKVPKAPGADELNRIELGYEVGGFDAGARLIAMTASNIDTRLLPEVADGQPYALITVVSVNPSNFENEALVCNAYIGEIREIQTHQPTIACHLRSEPGYSPP